MQTCHLVTVNALTEAPRIPVSDQIAQARETTGSGAAVRALAERTIGREPAVAPLIDLNAARARRAS